MLPGSGILLEVAVGFKLLSVDGRVAVGVLAEFVDGVRDVTVGVSFEVGKVVEGRIDAGGVVVGGAAVGVD